MSGPNSPTPKTPDLTGVYLALTQVLGPAGLWPAWRCSTTRPTRLCTCTSSTQPPRWLQLEWTLHRCCPRPCILRPEPLQTLIAESLADSCGCCRPLAFPFSSPDLGHVLGNAALSWCTGQPAAALACRVRNQPQQSGLGPCSGGAGNPAERAGRIEAENRGLACHCLAWPPVECPRADM